MLNNVKYYLPGEDLDFGRPISSELKLQYEFF